MYHFVILMVVSIFFYFLVNAGLDKMREMILHAAQLVTMPLYNIFSESCLNATISFYSCISNNYSGLPVLNSCKGQISLLVG